MKRVRKRLTYSNVMSSIAVFLVLGGATAFAALAKNSVGTKQLKNNAVTTKKIKKDAVTGAKVKESSLGTVPDSSKLGGQLPSAFQSRVMWALVNGNGTEIIKQSGGISLVGHVTGAYGVRFPVNTESGALHVTPAAAGFAGSGTGPIEAKTGPCPAAPDCSSVEGTTGNDAVVVIFHEGTLTNEGFYISLTQ